MLQDYLRCIGFSEYEERRLASILVKELFKHETGTQKACLVGENDYYSETRVEVAKGVGLCICGGFSTMEGESHASLDMYQYYPFNERNSLSLTLNGYIYERADKYQYIGEVIDDVNEIYVVFRLENQTEYMKRLRDNFPHWIRKTYLSGYAQKGKVILGIHKKEGMTTDLQYEIDRFGGAFTYPFPDSFYEELKHIRMERMHLASKKRFKYNVYQYVDTTFTPSGPDREIYFILGNILEIELLENHFSKERFYNLKLEVKNVSLHVMIHSEDLDGEPKIGYRFIGTICLFGRVEFT